MNRRDKGAKLAKLAKLGKVVGVSLAALVAGVSALVVLALLALRTPWGGEFVRKRALAAVGDMLAGRADAGGFRYGGDSLLLTDVGLRDPQGGPVMSARSILVRFSPLSFLRRRVVLREVAIDGARVTIVKDRNGTNLARAIAPRNQRPPRPDERPKGKSPGGKGWEIRLGALHVRDALVSYRDVEAGTQLRLDPLRVEGDGRFRTGDGLFGGVVTVEARVRDPFAAPVRLRVEAAGDPARPRVKVALDAGDTRARISAAGDVQRGVRVLEATVDELVVGPRLARAALPAYPLTAPVRLQGKVKNAGQNLDADLRVDSAGATATVRARYGARPVAIDAIVAVRALDLGRLIEGAPRSALALDLRAKASGPSAKALQGTATLTIPKGTLGGRPLGPIDGEARLRPGLYQLVRLEGALPGLTLSARGTLADEVLSAEARLVARDLRVLGRSLASADRRAGLPLSGSGRVDLSARGPLAAPAVNVNASFPAVAFARDGARSVTVAATLPAGPRLPGARAAVMARDVRAGGRALGQVALHLGAGEGGRMDALATVERPQRTRLALGGVWGDRGQTLNLQALTLTMPGLSWRLERPAMVALGPDRRGVSGARLVSGDQAIALDLDQRGERIDGRVTVTRLDLGRLPRWAIGERRLAGRLNLAAEATGRMQDPRFSARLALQGGRVDGVEDVEVKLQASGGARRVRGDLDAGAMGARARARFDLPTRFPGPAGERLRLDADLTGVDLARVLAEAARQQRTKGPIRRDLRGVVGATVSLAGTSGRPELDLTASAERLIVDDQPLGNVALKVTDGRTGPLEARLDVRGLGQPGFVRVRTPFETGDLLRHPERLRDIERFARAPIELDGRLDAIPLGAIARAVGYADPVGGTLSLRADLRGTVFDPRGTVTLGVAGARSGRFPPTDAAFRLASTAPDIHTALKITRKQRTLVHVDARLSAPGDRRKTLDQLAAAPLRVRANVGPLWLQRLGLPPETDDDPPRAMRGRVELALRVDGTPNDPKVALDGRAEEVALDKQSLGRADVRLRYAEARPAVEVALFSRNGGQLHLTGQGKLDLGARAIRRGLPPAATLPISARLSSKGFDLAWLSGASRAVPAVGGTLDATAKVDGSPASPRMDGRLEWKDGKVIVSGMGLFERVHLAVRGDQQRIVLEDLSAKSGAGNARLSGQAVRQGDGLALEGKAHTHEFLVRSQGQPLAAISLEAKVKGIVTPTGVRLMPVIDEAHVFVADGKRKNLQALERPDDVVLMKDGRPLNQRQRRRLEALRASIEQKIEVAAAAQSAPARGPVPVRVFVTAPRNLWVRAKDANIELGLGRDFRVEQDGATRIFGEVQVHRGFVKVLGRRFELEDASRVRFAGPPEAPILDVRAKYTAEQENVTVFVELSGTQEAPKFVLRSDPPHDQTALVTLLLTGRLDQDRKAGATSPEQRAASLVGGLMAKQLQSSVAKRLPLDVLDIQTGQGLTAAVLEAGTYLSDDLYVAYVGRLGADPLRYENRNAVHLEYQLTSRWSFEGEYGDARTGGADLVWKKHY